MARAEGNGTSHSTSKSMKFYYFDPLNPENVVEVVAKPQQQQRKPSPTPAAHAAPVSSSSSTPTTPSSSASHSNGNGTGHAYAHMPVNGSAHVAASANSSAALQVVPKDARKELAQVQGLALQLEAARSTILKLQQYEMMYKESRMRTKQMSAELASLQHMLAEKDAELARQYKRMEMEASERSALRNQFNAAIDEVKALRNELEDARQAMLDLKGALPAITQKKPKALLVGGRDDSSSLLELELDGAGAPEMMLANLQGLARQLADGMEAEVGSLFGAGKRDK